jgi:multidrug resistance efflux pump
MKSKKPEILYSDPVKEIIANPPGKIVRWGTTVILIVIVLLLIFSWIVKYPDIVPSPIEITTVNPPVTLATKITGLIKVFNVKDGEKVSVGKTLAVMETAASIDEVRKLKQAVDTIKRPEFLTSASLPGFSELGELQGYWSTFQKSLSDFSNYITNDFYGNKIASISEEIAGIEEYISRVREKEKLYAVNQALEAKKYARDSSLFTSGVFSESELEKSLQTLIRINIELQDVRIDYSEKSIELAQRNQDLQDYTIKRVEERERFYSVLNESLLNLKAQIEIWENTYLLVSPLDGVVAFTKFWKENQFVVKDEPVLSIVPFETGDFVGRINLKMQRSGKVETGQKVNIKLSGFPYLEYGMVRGVVKSKSLVPTGDTYVIEITLPEGLTTLYGEKLPFTQNMQGTAEILTDNLRLIQKITNPFRHLVTKNRI